jgi:hypothetical protein|tara:strand:+ start:372 stop:614 length:243 start_codon:yes stop_codon:yes gene_type:complete
MSYNVLKYDGIAYLKKKAESDKHKALMSLNLLLSHSAGIGDHSTKDFYDNLDEAFDTLVDAEDRLEVLDKHYSDIIKQIV